MSIFKRSRPTRETAEVVDDIVKDLYGKYTKAPSGSQELDDVVEEIKFWECRQKKLKRQSRRLF